MPACASSRSFSRIDIRCMFCILMAGRRIYLTCGAISRGSIDLLPICCLASAGMALTIESHKLVLDFLA